MEGYQIIVHFKNFSKYSIETHCLLDIERGGKIIPPEGFYNNEWPIFLQPHIEFEGFVDLNNLLSKFNIEEMRHDNSDMKENMLIIKLHFWYKRMNTNDEYIFNPIDLYFKFN